MGIILQMNQILSEAMSVCLGNCYEKSFEVSGREGYELNTNDNDKTIGRSRSNDLCCIDLFEL